MNEGRIVQISVSPGGVPKLRVPSARVTRLGVEGDRQRDHEHHGGPDRAVCLFANERIFSLQAEGHAIVPGSIGENVTLEGLDWDQLVPGVRVQLGDEVVLEITRYTSPCVNIRTSFANHDFSRVSQKAHPGWSRLYTRVLVEGRIAEGDRARRLSAQESLR